MRALLAAVSLTALTGCSLWLGGFEECSAKEDCEGALVCRSGYCVADPVPQGCGRVEGPVEAEGTIVLGAALPITTGGQVDQSEVMGLNAMLLALEEVNQREGVAGRRFALQICDTGRDPERIKEQVVWLAERAHVPAVLTSGSGQTLAAASVAIPRGTVLISATATSPELTTLPDSHQGSVGLVWRTAPSDAIQGAVIANLLFEDPRFASVQRVGLLFMKDPYGEGLASVLIGRFDGRAKTLLPVDYPRGGNVEKAVADLNALAPDLTILVAFPEDAVRILDQAATTSHLSSKTAHQWFFTDSAKDPDLLSGLATPGQLEGAWGTAPAQQPPAAAGPEHQAWRSAYLQFASSFQSRFGVDPAQFSFTSHSYDALYVLALGAAFAAGEDGAGAVTGVRLAEGLTRLSGGTTSYQLKAVDFTPARAALQRGESINIVGASGNLDFDPATGEAPSPIEIWQVEGSGFRTVDVRDPPGS